ncbi:MAG: hypothetical protein AB8H86_28515 [Polyangiales bacterium]
MSDVLLRMERIDLEDPRQREALRRGREAIETHALDRSEFDDAAALVGNDLLYMPCGFIGSVGALFVPSSSQYIQLGSYTSVDNFIWAYRRGVNLSGARGRLGSNTLVVQSVAFLGEAVEHLSDIFRQTPQPDLAERLANLPAVFDEVDLYFSIRQLRSIEESGICQFEIEATAPVSEKPL